MIQCDICRQRVPLVVDLTELENSRRGQLGRQQNLFSQETQSILKEIANSGMRDICNPCLMKYLDPALEATLDEAAKELSQKVLERVALNLLRENSTQNLTPDENGQLTGF